MEITKSKIVSVLRSENRTEIFKIAKMCGVDLTRRSSLHQWIMDNAPSKRLQKRAYTIAYEGNAKKYISYRNVISNERLAAIQRAKFQQKSMWLSHWKILIIGDKYIYWADPFYKHKDYNRSIAFPNNERNRILAEKINTYLNKYVSHSVEDWENAQEETY